MTSSGTRSDAGLATTLRISVSRLARRLRVERTAPGQAEPVLSDTQFAALAKRNDDEFLALLFAEFGVDSRRSQDWSSALVRYALEHRPELREVLTGWLGTWQPRALEAAESLAAAFASAPAAMAPSEVTSAVRQQHHAYLELCGL